MTRRHGTLVDWKDSRGFGFIEPGGSTERVFVHVSSFRSSAERPHIGLIVSFDTVLDGSGRKRAVNVLRPGEANRLPVGTRTHSGRNSRSSPGWLGRLLPVVVVLGLGAYFGMGEPGGLTVEMPPLIKPVLDPGEVRRSSHIQERRFECDGRVHCSQMRSCEEALFFIRNCPDTRMDGDHDGVPCESQWCTSRL